MALLGPVDELRRLCAPIDFEFDLHDQAAVDYQQSRQMLFRLRNNLMEIKSFLGFNQTMSSQIPGGLSPEKVIIFRQMYRRMSLKFVGFPLDVDNSSIRDLFRIGVRYGNNIKAELLTDVQRTKIDVEGNLFFLNHMKTTASTTLRVYMESYRNFTNNYELLLGQKLRLVSRLANADYDSPEDSD